MTCITITPPESGINEGVFMMAGLGSRHILLVSSNALWLLF